MHSAKVHVVARFLFMNSQLQISHNAMPPPQTHNSQFTTKPCDRNYMLHKEM